MDPKLLFWTFALADLGTVCVIALLGVRHARRGEIARHKRAMKIASLLILSFLGAYLVKLRVLGREDMSDWASHELWVLRIHELFVLLMMIGGSLAWIQSRKLIATQLVTHDPSDPLPDARTVRLHRLAGRTAVISAAVAFLLAIGILAGMIARMSGR